jgi:hypothetical protein
MGILLILDLFNDVLKNPHQLNHSHKKKGFFKNPLFNLLKFKIAI